MLSVALPVKLAAAAAEGFATIRALIVELLQNVSLITLEAVEEWEDKDNDDEDQSEALKPVVVLNTIREWGTQTQSGTGQRSLS